MSAPVLPSITDMLATHARTIGTRVAFSDDRRSVTYADLRSRTNRIAAGLASMGLCRGDRAAICMRNSVDMAEAVLAVATTGAIGVPLDPQSSDAELAHVLADSGATVIIADKARLDQLRRLRHADGRELLIVLAGEVPTEPPDGVEWLSDLAERDMTEPTPGSVGLDDPAWMLYTSGTTGAPKGVVSTQRNWLASLADYGPLMDLRAGDEMLWPLPMFHAMSHAICLLGTLAVGATTTLVTGFHPQDTWDALCGQAFTVFVGVPATYHQLVAAANETGTHPAALRIGITGGAPSTPALHRAVNDTLGIALVEMYGSTEASGVIAMARPGLPVAPGAIGPVTPGTQVRIVDPRTGLDVEAGGEGEIRVAGPGVMLGYHNAPEATARAVVDGWYRTGDLGRLIDGDLAVTGRLSELIIRGGDNLRPAEIEQVVRGVPGVADVVVVGAPDEMLGEVPVAYVVAESGGVDAGVLVATCRRELSGFKVPVAFYEIEALPRTRSGKIRRRAGGFLHDAAGFDAGFFGISPRRRWRWTRSSGCCWRPRGRRWSGPGSTRELRGSRTGVFAGADVQRLRRGRLPPDGRSRGLPGTAARQRRVGPGLVRARPGGPGGDGGHGVLVVAGGAAPGGAGAAGGGVLAGAGRRGHGDVDPGGSWSSPGSGAGRRTAGARRSPPRRRHGLGRGRGDAGAGAAVRTRGATGTGCWRWCGAAR
jgi:acyl-CoA synthetase (AMP-forming)/AMP-acid ligase II